MSRWIGAITNVGNDLLGEWVNEKTLHIDKVAFGMGTVSEESMVTQSDLVSQKQIASIVGSEQVASGMRIKIQITAPDIGYTLNQIGVWARVENADPVMLSLYQYDAGVPVPSKAESPEFVYTFYALISTSNQGQWSVSVDASAVVTQEQFDTHTSDFKNPHKVDCVQIGAVPTDEFEGRVNDILGERELYDHALNFENPHQVLYYQIGAAPAGYGLGEAVLFSMVDIDSKCNPGWYYSNESTTIDGFTNSRWWMHVKAYGTGSTFSTQELRTFYGNSIYRLERNKVNGTWGEWGWDNPPLKPNTEYRTTELFNGEPVYAKLIDFGAGPSSGSKAIYIADYVGDVVRVDGYWYQNSSKLTKELFASAHFVNKVRFAQHTEGVTGKTTWELVVEVNADGSSYNGLLVAYYTKRSI